MKGLVQISDMRRPHDNVNYYYRRWQDGKGKDRAALTPVEIANLERPKEVLALVEALTAMFRRIGMSEVCGFCWAGELGQGRKDMGCCGTCPLVGHKACLAKPMGCAFYMCDVVHRKFPRTAEFLSHLRYDLHHAIDKTAYVGCYPSAVFSESLLEFTEPEAQVFRVLTHAVNCWSEA